MCVVLREWHRGSWALKWALSIGLLANVVFWSCLSAQAARKQANADKLVQEVLQQETYGMDEHRSQLLASALRVAPAYAPARWHAGYVRLGNKWMHVDQVPKLSAADRLYQKYLRLRSQQLDTLLGNLELGRWCQKRHLADRARAHLGRVLELDPDHAEARRLLRFRRVEGVWVTDEEVVQMQQRTRQLQRDLAQFRPVVRQIAKQLTRTRAGSQQQARERLMAVDSPKAIPAMEEVLAEAGQRQAMRLVEALDAMSAREAALALARQAVFSRWIAVRTAAAEALKDRPLETFVPTMLSVMYKPIETRTDLRPESGGIVHQEVYSRGAYAEREETVVATTLLGLRARDAALIADTDLETRLWSRPGWVARQNANSQEVNRRISTALNLITKQTLPSEPEAWWEWWNDESGTRIAGKVTSSRRIENQLAYNVRPPELPLSPLPELPMLPSTRDPGQYHSCFAAGTPVWTVDGPCPVERVKVGDLVLSQDPDSGELAYKPVVRTTTATPAELVTLRIDGEKFDCTAGHLFWVCGDGWVRARKLNRNSALHTIDGVSSTQSVETGPVARTFNMVVADFNTYFVGRQKILVHDVTPQQPTTAVVPGSKR